MIAVSDVLFELNVPPSETLTMAAQVPVNKYLALGIRYLDQNAQPIASAVQPDSPPSWSNAAAIGSLEVSEDGRTAIFKPSAAGSTVIRLTLAVAGRTYNAEVSVDVIPVEAPAPQDLTSIEITTNVVDPPATPPPA
jgi:hypothetical protein